MRVLAHDVRPDLDAARQLGVSMCDWDTLLAESDVLSVHAALTPATRGLLGKAEFSRMKPGAMLINTSRGAIVDQDALSDALARGGLAGAGLDVLAVEPPRLEILPLLRLPNVVITPHCAGTTVESTTRGAAMAAENVARVLEGRRPLSTVNPEVLERLGLT
jgi:phosphoglycerate dehydrogenase-like enzyme